MVVLAEIDNRRTVIDYCRILGVMFWRVIIWPFVFSWRGPLRRLLLGWSILFLEAGSLWLCWRVPNNPWCLGAGILLAIVYLAVGFIVRVVYGFGDDDDNYL